MAPQGSGWELGGAASQTSLKVAPGEPGIDVTSPGVLEIGGDVATSVELGPSGVLVDAAGNVAARSFTATNGPNTPNANPGQVVAAAGLATYGPSSTEVATSPPISRTPGEVTSIPGSPGATFRLVWEAAPPSSQPEPWGAISG